MNKILIVDDDIDICNLIKSRLEPCGFEVLVSTNAVEAFALSKDMHPDLIILDVCMPMMDGLKFIQEIKWKKEFEHTSILILSGRSDIKNLCDDQNINFFLEKPFEKDQLMKAVQYCLREKKKENYKKILVVDDEPDISYLISNRLELNGYEVEIASDGLECLEKVKECQPDAIILDVAMPNVDGFQVCQALKSNPKFRNIPIIMLTARTSKADRKIIKELQADAYITKPFNAQSLLKHVEELTC